MADWVPPLPGDIDINAITITNYNGSESSNVQFITREFNIYESIFSNHLRADIVLEDALSLTARLPIIGDEQVTFQFRTPTSNPNSETRNWFQQTFCVAKLRDFSLVQTRSAVYTIELVPQAQIKNLTQTINTALGPGTISSMVPTVAQKLGLNTSATGLGAISSALSSGAVGTQLSSTSQGLLSSAISQTAATGQQNSIEIETTTGTHQFAIPNMTPYETLNFLASEAQSSANKPSNYFFFQNHLKHYFCTVDYLIKKSSTSANGVPTYYFYEQSHPDAENPVTGSVYTSTGSYGQNAGTTALTSGTNGAVLTGVLNSTTGASASATTSGTAVGTVVTTANSTSSASANNDTDFRAMAYLRFNTMFDVESNIMDGLYDNTVYMIDPLLQRFEPVKVGSNSHFIYNAQFGDFAHTAGKGTSQTGAAVAAAVSSATGLNISGTGQQIVSPNSKLRNLSGQSHQRMLITNKYQDSTYVVYPRKRQDFLPWLISANAQLKAVVCELTIPGDSDRAAGDIIAMDFHEVGATQDIMGSLNKYLSGRYLVVSVRHKYTDSAPMKYLTIMELVKNCFEQAVSHDAVTAQQGQAPNITAASTATITNSTTQQNVNPPSTTTPPTGTGTQNNTGG